jgi:hypothetical protein
MLVPNSATSSTWSRRMSNAATATREKGIDLSFEGARRVRDGIVGSRSGDFVVNHVTVNR